MWLNAAQENCFIVEEETRRAGSVVGVFLVAVVFVVVVVLWARVKSVLTGLAFNLHPGKLGAPCDIWKRTEWC